MKRKLAGIRPSELISAAHMCLRLLQEPGSAFYYDVNSLTQSDSGVTNYFTS
jgi:hypothetical protein